MNRHKYEGAILALLGLIGSSATAMAQNAAQPAQPAPAANNGTMGLGLSAGTTTTPVLDADANSRANAAAAPAPMGAPPPLPPAAPADGAVAATPEQTDHDSVVGGVGVGYLGGVSLDNLNADGSSYSSIPAPIVGARLWLDKSLGLEFGIGLNHQSGTYSNNVVGQSNLDDPTIWAFAGHAGVPLSLFSDKHYSFLVMPEANFGMSTWRLKDDGNDPADTGASGRAWLAQVGLRAGAEIHFGFMGLPMLSLTGTVGAHLTYRDTGIKTFDSDGNEVKQGHYTLGLTTIEGAKPWDIFQSGISALYYFK